MSFFFAAGKEAPPTPPAPSKGAEDDKKASSRVVMLMKQQLSQRPSHGTKGGRSRVTTKLVGFYTMNGNGGSATFGVQALTPIGVQDWAGFAALYDLARVASIRVTVQPYFSATGSSGYNGGQFWLLAFDPANPGAYSNFTDLMTAKSYLGPIGIDGQGGTASVPGAQAIHTCDKTGMLRFTVKLPAPKMQIAQGSGTTVVGGGWFATGSSAYTVGYLKDYIGNVGSTSVLSLGIFVEYFCEFTNRT